MKSTQSPHFKIISAPQIESWLEANPQQTVDLIRDVYLLHADGKTVNPNSCFLRFPDSDSNRIIALPASIESTTPIAGIKWISSFPGNIDNKLNRASAVLLINDRKTGYPLACMEGSLISAARTAASAVVGAYFFHPTTNYIACLGVIGCGLIAYSTVSLLSRLGWKINELCVTDLSEERTASFCNKCAPFVNKTKISDLQTTISKSDLVLFATSSTVPFITSLNWFDHAPTVLHISLRDLSPEIILASQNVADDVDHCLKAETSLHIAFQKTGNKNFILGNAAAAIRRQFKLNFSCPRIFSPFGMGILDLALAQEILSGINDNQVLKIEDFFPFPYC